MKIRKTTRSTVGHFSRLFVIFVMICISPAAAFAESCYQVGGCVGLIGALRVNKDGAIENGVKLLFGLDQPPKFNSEVKIKRAAVLRQIIELRFDDRDLRPTDNVSGGKNSTEGQYLPPGTTVRVLGYQLHSHLFVIIQVVAIPTEEEQKTYVFDLNNFI